MNYEWDSERNSLDGYGKVWTKQSSITLPGASQAFTFADDHEYSIQDAVFGVNVPGWQPFGQPLCSWIDFPATRHGQAGSLAFADGHAEIWKWIESNTAEQAKRPPQFSPPRQRPMIAT